MATKVKKAKKVKEAYMEWRVTQEWLGPVTLSPGVTLDEVRRKLDDGTAELVQRGGWDTFVVLDWRDDKVIAMMEGNPTEDYTEVVRLDD